MICTCVYCLYTFEADELPFSCPDCGKGPVRQATHDEKNEYAFFHQALSPEKAITTEEALSF